MIILGEAFLVLVLVAWVMWLIVGALQARIGVAREPSAPRPPAGPGLVDEARRAGEEDMRTAWVQWQLRPLPERTEQKDLSVATRTLAVVPKADWDVERLREYGRAVWALRADDRLRERRAEVDALLDRVAAMISDLTDEEFDTGLGQSSDQYLYHQDREVRLAYLVGGGRGVEAIMDAVTAARAQIRQDAATQAATQAAAESLVQQRNAALKALRETHRPGEARGDHADWGARAKRIGEE